MHLPELVLAIASACLRAHFAEAVIPRQTSVVEPGMLQPRPRVGVDDAMLDPTLLGIVAGSAQRSKHNYPLFHFRASSTRCCRAGEIMAKKRLPCSSILDDPANNLVQKDSSSDRGVVSWTEVLHQKAQVCSLSKYSFTMEKCCRRREEFYRKMEDCRGRRGSERRRCREEARRKYGE